MTRDLSYEEQAPPSLMPTIQPLPHLLVASLAAQQPHLINHHAPLEDRHEVRRLLAHCDPDLHWFIVVLLVQDNSLIS